MNPQRTKVEPEDIEELFTKQTETTKYLLWRKKGGGDVNLTVVDLHTKEVVTVKISNVIHLLMDANLLRLTEGNLGPAILEQWVRAGLHVKN